MSPGYKWVGFILGTTLSTTVIVYELATSNICVTSGTRNNKTDDFGLLIMFNVSLVMGLFLDIGSALFLSCWYQQPLNARSLHKVYEIQEIGSVHRSDNCLSLLFLGVFERLLIPAAWGIICILIGLASALDSETTHCDGNDSKGLSVYLDVSGFLLLAAGVIIGVLGGLVFFSGCVCKSLATKCFTLVVKARPFLDYVWQLQAVVWAYHRGSITPLIVFILWLVGFSGHVLALISIFAPLDQVMERLV